MEHGLQAEDNLELICHRIFGCDFVLRSPSLEEESGSKELADILILVDDTIVIFQSKSLVMDIDTLDNIKFERIRRKYNKAKKQINTTLNAQTRGVIAKAQTPLGIEFEIPWNKIKRKIGIITLNIRDNLYDNPDFRFQFPTLVENYKGICVHTFILTDLWQMSKMLTTPADFFHYVQAREKAFLKPNIIVGNELDFLAVFKKTTHNSKRPYQIHYSEFLLRQALGKASTASLKKRLRTEKISYFMAR